MIFSALCVYYIISKKLPSKIDDAPQEKKINKDNLYACPICKKTMKRFIYKISSTVLIDKCENHGIWLNHGELKTLIEWKQSYKKGLNCSYCHKLNPLNDKLFESKEKIESKHLCPCCKINLETLKTSTVVLEYCKECDGILITEEEFEKLISYKVDPLSTFNPYYLRFIQDHPRDNRKKPQFHPALFVKRAWLLLITKRKVALLLTSVKNMVFG